MLELLANILPFFLSIIFALPPVPAIVNPIPVEAAEMPQTVDIGATIQAAATKYGLNYNHLYATLDRESGGFQDVAIQSQFPGDGPNGKENSWGICQINLDANTSITKEEAINPVWCINWTAQQWVAGNANHWTAYRQLKAKYGDGTWPTP